MAVASPKAPGSAVLVPTLNNDELLALLGQSGNLPQSQGEFHRMTVKAGILSTDDGEIFPPKRDGPAVTVRIVDPPVYYNAIYLTDQGGDGGVNADIIGHPELNGRFTRKYDDPAQQAADTNPANAFYDEIAAAAGIRGQFKGDMKVQIIPEATGKLVGDETIYNLSLSTTSVFEFRGSSRDPIKGSVSDENFIVKLSKMAAEAAGGDTDNQRAAILKAMTSLRLGGVAADIYPIQQQNPTRKEIVWTVLRFDPVHIEDFDDTSTETIAAVAGAPDATAASALPF